jgi:hypothetical protein
MSRVCLSSARIPDNPYIRGPEYDPFDVIRHIPQDIGDILARTTY